MEVHAAGEVCVLEDGLGQRDLFSTDVLTTNHVLDNVLGVKSNSSEENTVSAPKLETALQWEK